MEDSPQQERDLGGSRTNVSMRFVQDDPTEQPSAVLNDRGIPLPDQHVFEHGGVGDQHRWRSFSQSRAIADLWTVESETAG
jgi:hypothetical protein